MGYTETLKGTRLLQEVLGFLGSDKRILVFQGGTRCFTGDTLVATPSGHKRIDEIAVGDAVVTAGCVGSVQKVFEKVEQGAKNMVRITFTNGEHYDCTYDHLVFSEGRYTEAIIVAMRGVASGARVRGKIRGVQHGAARWFELQELWPSANFAPCGDGWLLADDATAGRWLIPYGEGASHCRGDVSAAAEAGSRSRQSQGRIQAQQSGVEFGVGVAPTELGSRHAKWPDGQYNRESERNGAADRARRAGHQDEVQPIQGNGEGLGEGVRGVNGLRKGYSSWEDMGACSSEPDDIASVEFYATEAPVYDLNVFPTNLYCVTESSRLVHNSGKSYAIAQGLNVHAHWMRAEIPSNQKFRYSILRKRMPSLKGTAMRDFFEVMENHGWYDHRDHNKTDNEYHLGHIEFEFLSLDDPQKIRGRKRQVAWLNEANEFTFEDFKQIAFRTTDKLILDYNPSEEYHWIYDKILTRDDVHYVQSTYRDNPFLSDATVKEIEWLREVDDNAWRIYGMGERGSSGAAIYPRFEIIPADEFPEDDEPCYGVDFGYNEPSSIVECVRREDEDGQYLYFRERLYETKLTTRDMISRLGQIVGNRYLPIYADSSSPDRIEEIFRAGYNIQGADKRNYSVKDGIDFVKRHKIFVTADSENMIREMRGYKWKQDNQDRIIDEPVKFRDHSLDAARYAAYTHYGNPVTWLFE